MFSVESETKGYINYTVLSLIWHVLFKLGLKKEHCDVIYMESSQYYEKLITLGQLYVQSI
jgi:hypothetical protein